MCFYQESAHLAVYPGHSGLYRGLIGVGVYAGISLRCKSSHPETFHASIVLHRWIICVFKVLFRF